MLFHKIYGDAHTFVQTKLHAKMTLLEALYIRQCIDLLEGLNIGNSDPTSKYSLLYSNIYLLEMAIQYQHYKQQSLYQTIFVSFLFYASFAIFYFFIF